MIRITISVDGQNKETDIEEVAASVVAALRASARFVDAAEKVYEPKFIVSYPTDEGAEFYREYVSGGKYKAQWDGGGWEVWDTERNAGAVWGFDTEKDAQKEADRMNRVNRGWEA